MDFCDRCLNPNIRADKPSADGREIENLISEDVALRRNGFMAAYFVRPPVNIYVNFEVPVDIRYVKLGVRVNQMNSTALSVFTKPEEISQVRLQSKDSCADSKKALPSFSASDETVSNDLNIRSGPSTSSLTQPKNASDGDACFMSLYSENDEKKQQTEEISDDVYFCVGKYYTDSANVVLLKNPYYRHLITVPMPHLESELKDSETFTGVLKHPNRLALRGVTSILIRIMKTASGSPPVLQSIQVWGQPGISTSKLQRKDLLNRWSRRVTADDTVPHIPRIFNSEPQVSRKEVLPVSTPPSNDSLDIPEDFLDPITCEVMNVPLLLPSGQTIDASTLDKFIASESVWGRPPSDPFTGVPFSGMRKPSPNVSLKARIDRYLLLHVNHPDVIRSGRTVGSASGISLRSLQQQDTSRVPKQAVPFQRKEWNVASVPNVLNREEDISERNRASNIGHKNSLSGVEVTSEIPTDSSCALRDEIEAALQGKPRFVPVSSMRADNFDTATVKSKEKVTSDAVSVKSSPLCSKLLASRSRLQALSSVASSAKRSAVQTTKTSKKSCSGHHSLVQMIGGALSVAQGQSLVKNDMPLHRPSAKPGGLIHGDEKPKHFTVTSLNPDICLCGASESLYKLLCNHILCRTCLLQQQTKTSQVECKHCGRISESSDVRKHNKKSIFPD